MTRNEAALRIQDRLGQRTGLLDMIYAEMRAAQDKLEQGVLLPWFLRTQEIYYNNTQAENDFPQGFIRETDEGLYIHRRSGYTIPGEEVPLERNAYEALQTTEELRTPGLPRFYSFYGSTWRLYPRPDQPYSIVFTYYKKECVLTTDTTNNWLNYAGEYLIAEAGLRVAKTLRDPGYIQLFGQDREEARESLIRVNAAQTAYTFIRGD